MENLTIRALIKNELSMVAEIHINAFSDSALAGLGHEAVRRYYEWQLEGPHDAIALGVFQAERLAGFCFAGVFHGALVGFLQKNRRFLVWRVVTHPSLIISPFFRDRIRMALSILGHSSNTSAVQLIKPGKSFGILAIAVDPQIQRAGMGQLLMAETERSAIERGFTGLHLTVDINNTQAIAFYQKLNWQKLPGADGVWRGSMVKDLSGLYG